MDEEEPEEEQEEDEDTVKTTGNGSTSIGEVTMPRIRDGSGKDFMTKSKEN